MSDGAKITRQRELEAEVNHLVPRLVMLGAELVVLHGAVARGRAGADAKINLLVVAASELAFRERQEHFRERLRSGEPLALVVFTPAEFARARDESVFVRHALAKGRVVYSPERG